MYQYKALVLRVVDGDTYDVAVALGFTVNVTIRIRLKGIDCPETFNAKTPEEKEAGLKTTEFVKNLIGGQVITLRSHKMAVYNRYEADITMEDGRDLATVIKEAGFIKVIF
jgi:micrococcal nuclease